MISKLALPALAAPMLAFVVPTSAEDADAPGAGPVEPPSILETIRDATWEEFEAAAL